MAMRAIVKKTQDVMRKMSKTVTVFDEKLAVLLDDMKESMNAADGVGLAAVQVGILKKVFIMDVGDGLVEAINPEVCDFEGEQRDVEGCLSCPYEFGYVTRPMSCTLKAQDRKGEAFEMRLEGLACRCACHETDHLSGVLFIDKVDEWVEPEENKKMKKR